MLAPHHDIFEEFEAFPSALHIGGLLWDDIPEWLEKEPPPAQETLTGDAFVTSAVYTMHTGLHRPITEWEKETRQLVPGDRLVEYMPDDAYHSHEPPPGLYCVVSGRFKLVVTHAGETRVVAQCRKGQLLGAPRVLRMYLGMRDVDLPWPRDTTIEAVALEGEQPVVRFIPLATAFDMLDVRADFRRFLVNQLEVRFIRRRRILEIFARNHVLRYIPPHDREYLLQLGGLRSFDYLVQTEDEVYRPTARYLPSGKRTARAALLLDGECMMYRPVGADGRRYVGKVGAGELFGHESITEVEEPVREMQMDLSRGSAVFEISWSALKSALLQSGRAWTRVMHVHQGIEAGGDAPVPGVIAFQAARVGLDVTTLAYGMSAVLAHDAGATVHLVDTGGEASFRRMVEAGPGDVERWPTVVIPIDQSTGGVPALKVAWPEVAAGQQLTPADVESVIDRLLCATDDVIQWIVVVHDPGSGPAAASFGRELADRLNLRSRATFFVSDDTEAPYDLTAEVPNELTWVYRMNAAYMERERHYTSAHPEDSLGALMPLRRVVRVPEKLNDPILAPEARRANAPARRDVFETSRLARAFDPAIVKASPLARAFHRLARVVEGRTVGLALSGGGAWGFSHMPLIEALEEQGIPIDFVTGTSFGSVVGAIYAAGGTDALRTFVEENCAKPGDWINAGTVDSVRMVLGSQITMATFMFAPIDSAYLQRFIDRTVERYSGHPSLLTTTEVPFYPVGTDLDSQREMFNMRKSVGWGVRMSGAMPPIFPPVEVKGDGREPPAAPEDDRHFIYRANPPRARDSHHIVDGAFIANVPSRVARQVGAHFVIASNVIPPAPGDAPHFTGIFGFMQWMALKWTPQSMMRRGDDLNRATFLQTWKGGDDQGAIWADYRVTLQPQGYQFFEMWLGRDMWEAVANVIDLRGIRQIRERWEALHPRLNGHM